MDIIMGIIQIFEGIADHGRIMIGIAIGTGIERGNGIIKGDQGWG